jgi:hypothetical protein
MSTEMARNYVNNRDFFEAIKTYKEKVVINPNTRIPDYIGACILKICERLSTKPNFVGYSFRDEMIADGVENCIHSVLLFNIERSDNPFAYFTQIAWNAFLRRIAKEKKEQYIKYKNMQNSFLESDYLDESLYGDSGGVIHTKNNDVANEIIGSFEKKMLTKPKKVVKIGLEKFCEGAQINGNETQVSSPAISN